MHVEIEGSAYVGVPEEDTDGFVVAFALNAAGGKAVAKAVEAHFGKAQLLLELVEVRAICAGFCWLSGIGEDEEIPPEYLLQGAD